MLVFHYKPPLKFLYPSNPSLLAMAASADLNSNYSYNVFINHRGPDVKKTFASYLYRRLLSHGLRVFLDQPELQQGDKLTSQIDSAIKTASVHVAIFSPGYAESNWCLDELLLMLESGATTIPVFYHVRPAELRWTRGKDGQYAQALQKLEKKKRYDPQTNEEKPRYDSTIIESWRNALSSVAGVSGFELEACNGDEGELLDKVVERVLKKVKKTSLDVAKYPIGLDEKVKDFESKVLLQKEQSGKPQVVGIVGVGGVGKTTLAKELFNRKSSHYSRSCFLFDVRENAGKGSLIVCQSKLLKSLTGLDTPIDSIDEGIQTLRKHLSSHQSLIILDDVDHVNQVDALLPHQTVLPSDSLILITSRDKDVLTSSRVENSSIYKLTGLNTQYSRDLFCSHAFGHPHPLPEFESLVNKFLEACDGLPLSLKVFGALLYGKNDISYWEYQLDRVKEILPNEIQERLKISYQALDQEEKQLFLDIACFLIGQNRDTAIRIWDGSGWKGWLGFQNLQSKCLVEVDSENNIQMHDHLRDLGRNVAQDSLPRRLWRWTENVIDNLLEQSSAISVRGIRMVLSEYNDDDDDAYDGIHMRRLQLLDTEDVLLERIWKMIKSPNLIWLRWNKCSHSSLPPWIQMKNLRVLQVSGGALKTLWEGQSQAPLLLRELHILAPLSNIPKSIGQLKHLERVVISFSSSSGQVDFEKLPEEFCHMQSLKTLVLKCSKLKTLPDSFGNLTNLQHINLSGCRNLERLPNSFGNLIKLKYLDLSLCCNLTIETFGNISTLEYIDLSDCTKIEVLPQQVVYQRSLEKLDLSETNLKELPSAIGELSDLEVLILGSPVLDTLPPSIGDLRNLKDLMLDHCKKLTCLPASVGLLNQLTRLRVRDCPLRELLSGERETFPTLSNLDSSFHKCMPRLQYFRMSKTEIPEVSFAEGICPNLHHLYIQNCNHLVKVGILPNTLIKLELDRCSNLRKIEGLSGLVELEMLHIWRCGEVEELAGIETLVSLEELWAPGCVKLKSIRGLAQLTKLRSLDISQCSELEDLENVEHCVSLEKLNAYGCPRLRNCEVVLQLRQRLRERR